MRGYNKNNNLHVFLPDPSPPPSPHRRGEREIFELRHSLSRGEEIVEVYFLSSGRYTEENRWAYCIKCAPLLFLLENAASATIRAVCMPFLRSRTMGVRWALL